MNSPPLGIMRRDGTVDNRAAIQWWTDKLFESTHLRYRVARWWEQKRGNAVRPDTAYIDAHIRWLTRMQVESWYDR